MRVKQSIRASFIAAALDLFLSLAGFSNPQAVVSSENEMPRCSIVLSPVAPPLERFASSELRRYLYDLYGMQVSLTHSISVDDDVSLIVGSPATNPAVTTVLGTSWPKVSDQGIVLKKAGVNSKAALVLGGGSPEATLWAVYEFVERAGVRFLLEKDVLPETPALFPPAELNVVKEPDFRFRSYRGINDLATSLVFYGMDDYRHLIDQLAKMRFNVFYVQTYPYQPFVHYEFRGQKKTTGVLHYGWKLPIHENTIGKELFGGKRELENPAIEGAKTYEERVHGSVGLLHNLFAYAKSRGMKTGLMFWINQFTDEFTRRLPEWSDRTYASREAMKGTTRSSRLGVAEDGMEPVSFPYMSAENPVVMELNRTIVRAHVDTYPEADFYGLFSPELPRGGEEYRELWQRLNRKHQLEPQFNLQQMVRSAQQNLEPVGVRRGTRPLQELKGAIAYADVLDRLIYQDKILEKTANPRATIVISSFSDEFYPVMAKIFAGKAMQQVQMDYLASLAAKRTEMLSFAAMSTMKSAVMQTLADDNIGILPQLPTPSLHKIVEAMKRYKLEGFFGRQFLVTKLEAATSYLAQSAWNSVTPEQVYRDQVLQVCGTAAVSDVLAAYRVLEEATLKLDEVGMRGVPGGLHYIKLYFPVPTMMREQWQTTQGPDAGWEELLPYYRKALPLLESALAKCRPSGKSYVAQLAGQVRFSIDYVQAIQELRRARLIYEEAQLAFKERNPTVYDQKMYLTHERLERALNLLKSSIEHWAAVVRDPSDLGALAVLNCYCYDYLKGLAYDIYLESQRRTINF